MVFEGENWEGIDVLHFAKFGNNKLDRGFAKYYIIKIEILIIHIKIFHLPLVHFLFGRIISNISRFYGPRINDIDWGV
jgi:hypothetical protein